MNIEERLDWLMFKHLSGLAVVGAPEVINPVHDHGTESYGGLVENDGEQEPVTFHPV